MNIPVANPSKALDVPGQLRGKFILLAHLPRKAKLWERGRSRNGTSRPHHTETGRAGSSSPGLPSFLMELHLHGAELLFPTLPGKFPAPELSCPGSFGHSTCLELKSSPALTSLAQIPDVQPGSFPAWPRVLQPRFPAQNQGWFPALAGGSTWSAQTCSRGQNWSRLGQLGIFWEQAGERLCRESQQNREVLFSQFSVKLWQLLGLGSNRRCPLRFLPPPLCSTGIRCFSHSSFPLLYSLSSSCRRNPWGVPPPKKSLEQLHPPRDDAEPNIPSRSGSPPSVSHLPWPLPEHPRS